MAADKRYLKWHGNQWRVNVKVPDRLRAIVGKAHLIHPLHTDSLIIANRDKYQHVAAFKEQLQKAERQLKMKAGVPADPVTEEALGWRDSINASDATQCSSLVEEMDGNERESEGDVFRSLLADRAEEIERRDGYATARDFYDVASGKVTPISPLVEPWLAHKDMKPRQVLDYRRAAHRFAAWLGASKLPQSVEGVTRRIAGRYVTEAFLETGTNVSTARKDISALSSLWRWLEVKGHAGENVWRGQSPPKRQPKSGEGKREFTDQEMLALFETPPSVLMADFMAIAALSGMRVNEIARLTAGSISQACFDIREAKTKAGVRMVPIHSLLTEIVRRRCADKKPTDPLFPELPEPKPGSAVERSQKVVKAFVRYRRSVGVDEVVAGARQSRVDFHSFRRWFITRAEQAYQPPHIIAALVGHARAGETLGRYSGRPLVQQYLAVVEAINLPEGVTLPKA